jgi:hypothetical protein
VLQRLEGAYSVPNGGVGLVAYPHPFSYDAVPAFLASSQFTERMLSTVLAATAVLRLHFRRLRSIGLLGAVTALGLVPLSLYMPRAGWARYTMLSLVCLYAGRKVVQFLRSRAALRQFSMEEHFLRYGSSAGRVQKCIESDSHLWTRSCILGGLKGLMHHPITTDMIGDEKRDRVYRQFHRAFRKLEPAHAYLDSGLLLSLIVLVIAIPSIGINLRAILFQAGFLALAVAAIAEISHLIIRRRLFETMRRFYGTLTEWAIREALHAAVTASYSHRRLYFAPPWFADSSDVDDDIDADPDREAALFVIAGESAGQTTDEVQDQTTKGKDR